MRKWIAGSLAAGLLVAAIPTLAAAGSSAKHHCKVNLTVRTFRMKTYSGNPPASGHDLIGGTADGKICGKAFRGAVREENRYPQFPKFTTHVTIFGPQGSVRTKGSGAATVNPDSTLTLTGKLKITGGSVTFKGASGSIAFTGHTKQNSPAVFHYTGTVNY